MADIFDELEQDLRAHRARRAWERWGRLLVALAVAVVLAIAGWRGWASWEQSRAAQWGDRYSQAVASAEAGQRDDAIRELEAVARDGTGSYRTLARFRIAAERAAKGDAAAAVRDFDALAEDAALPESWRDIARVRSGMVLVDSGTPQEVAARVERLAVAGNAMRHAARELLGLAAYKAGDKPAAARWFQQLVTDGDAPESARNRGSTVLSALAADGVTPGGG